MLPPDSDVTGPEPLGGRLYDELRRLAAAELRRERPGHTLQATALVHEAFLRLSRSDGLQGLDPPRVKALAASTIRRVLVDHARARLSDKRGGGAARITLGDTCQLTAGREVHFLALEEALEKLAGLDPRQHRVVELRFFGGLSIDEAAGELGVSARTVNEEWRTARAWLRRELGRQGAA